MPQPRRRASFPQKTKSRRLVTEIFFANDFQCHGAAQIDVEGLVSDPHCTAPQLDRFPVFALDQFVMLKALHRLLWCGRLGRILGSRSLAGLNPISKSLPKHAHRTEFHCSSKLITTDRADASGLRFHGPNRPSDAIRASQSAWISPSIPA